MRRTLLLLVLTGALAHAQESGGETFTPFVSRLKAQASQQTVLLTWRNPVDSADAAGAKLVYRGPEEIRADTLPAATLVARLAAEAESFEDRPPDTAPCFYAVLIEGPEGRRYDVLVPFRNKTSQAVQVSGAPPEEELAASVTGLRAEVTEDFVLLAFRSSRPQRELLLFRGTTPMSAEEHLHAADTSVVLAAGTLEYRDYPVPGVDACYAVVDAGLFKVGRAPLVPGDNATPAPVQVPLSVPRVALPPAGPSSVSSRSSPLPYLRFPASALPPTALEVAAGRARALKPLKPLKPETLETLERLLPQLPTLAPAARSVEILDEDRPEIDAAGSRSLGEILRQQLQTGRYAHAETGLRWLLTFPRPAPEQARIRFYLGQSLYMQGLYQEAALEFLLARDPYYARVQPWLEDSFRLIHAR